MKKLFLSVVASLFFTLIYPQAFPDEIIPHFEEIPDSLEGWKKGMSININFSQVSLNNWASGGQSSVSVNGLTQFFLQYKKRKTIWENNLDIAYGSIKQEEDTQWQKTDDKLDFTSKLGRKAFRLWNYTLLFNFRTQFTQGYKLPNDSVIISDFMAPGYFLLAIGMDYQHKGFSAFLSPFTSKITVVNNQFLANTGAFGVEAAQYDKDGVIIKNGKQVLSQLGGYARFSYQGSLMKNVELQSRLDVFSNYLNQPENIDISWENLLKLKVNKFISATISTHLLYDHEVKTEIDDNNDGIIDRSAPRTQFKEVIGIGFLYTIAP